MKTHTFNNLIVAFASTNSKAKGKPSIFLPPIIK